MRLDSMWTPSSTGLQFPLGYVIDSCPPVVSPDMPVIEAIQFMNRADHQNSGRPPTQTGGGGQSPIEWVMVVKDDRLVGSLTRQAIAHQFILGNDLTLIRVAEIMTPPKITLAESDLGNQGWVISQLNQYPRTPLPVLNPQGQLVSVVRHTSSEPQLSCEQPDSDTFIKLQQALRERDLEVSYLREALHQEASLRQKLGETLWENQRTSQLVQTILQDVSQSLDLSDVFDITVQGVLRLLQADRVNIYRLESRSTNTSPSQCASAVAEARISDCPSIQGFVLFDPVFCSDAAIEQYRQGFPVAISDIQTTGLDRETIELFQFFEVRAKLVVPVLKINQLWGWLVVHQCRHPRQWETREIDLLRQIAVQVGIAIRQAELYSQVQRLNAGLEAEVQERTNQFQRAINLEATLKRITDKVRDSLDESQILQTAVRELALVLEVNRCTAAIYDQSQKLCTIQYEYTQTEDSMQGMVEPMAEAPEFYRQLRRGKCFQFCEFLPYLNRGQVAILTCPIFDNQDTLGDLRLYAQRGHGFSDLEVRMVQQVANQCAIAIRQARFYQALQKQVEELERLNGLKDDFLSTVSHELRTPLSSIKMAVQVLEMTLKRHDEASPEHSCFTQTRNKIASYLEILQEECDREINLINNVLTFQQLEADNQPLLPTPIRLQDWLPHVAEVFEEVALTYQLQLQIEVPANLPTLTSDLFMLDHILQELLTNACKFTPIEGTISLSASEKNGIQIVVKNSGVEIPPQEQTHIFEKFYRIPSNDPWKRGGTGLGLALVKKMAECLEGSVWVESTPEWTSFYLQLPLKLEKNSLLKYAQ